MNQTKYSDMNISKEKYFGIASRLQTVKDCFYGYMDDTSNKSNSVLKKTNVRWCLLCNTCFWLNASLPLKKEHPRNCLEQEQTW